MIYSPAFDALPPRRSAAIYARMRRLITDRDTMRSSTTRKQAGRLMTVLSGDVAVGDDRRRAGQRGALSRSANGPTAAFGVRSRMER